MLPGCSANGAGIVLGTTAKARQGSGVSVAADGCRAGSDSACPHAGPSGASIAMDSTKSVRRSGCVALHGQFTVLMGGSRVDACLHAP